MNQIKRNKKYLIATIISFIILIIEVVALVLCGIVCSFLSSPCPLLSKNIVIVLLVTLFVFTEAGFAFLCCYMSGDWKFLKNWRTILRGGNDSNIVHLPESETYELEMKYFPWGRLIEKVVDYVCEIAPRNGRVVDLMCGPGYLLGKIKEKRPDLILTGIDSNEDFIGYARNIYTDISFKLANILAYKSEIKYEIVLCTGGVHHLPYTEQAGFIKLISIMLKPAGVAIIADPLVEEYSSEAERKISATKLGYKYLLATIKKNAPDKLLKAAIDIMCNDVLQLEYKNHHRNMVAMLKSYFCQISEYRFWPERDVISEKYGDYVFICKQPIK